ncbi:MAG: class I SAM-dependent methyltransferase [Candidatus Solibacter sp.]
MRFPQAIAARLQEQSARVERARAEFNFRSIQALVPRGCKVLDVGAWSCYLGELLRDQMGCEVLSLDVVNANKTGMPFRVFDGKALPVESRSFDVVLLLYVLHHAADDRPLLAEASRVLRDGGCLLIGEDSVDGVWNRTLTVGFHVWLWLATGMAWDGKFRATDRWRARFHAAGFEIKDMLFLGHHLGRFFWPNNVLFVLKKDEGDRQQAGI